MWGSHPRRYQNCNLGACCNLRKTACEQQPASITVGDKPSFPCFSGDLSPPPLKGHDLNNGRVVDSDWRAALPLS